MSSVNDPYAAIHASPQGEGDARPTALQIIHDEELVNKLADKVMLVTGSSSGIGADTVAALHATGAHVFMQVRDMEKGKAVMEKVLASSKGKGKLELIFMELGSLASVRAGAAEFLSKSGNKLNVLDSATPQKVAHQLLLPALLPSSTPASHSRVINVSSGSHRNGDFNLPNLNLEGIYTPRLAYAQSKTANILTAHQIERLYGTQGLHGLLVYARYTLE